MAFHYFCLNVLKTLLRFQSFLYLIINIAIPRTTQYAKIYVKLNDIMEIAGWKYAIQIKNNIEYIIHIFSPNVKICFLLLI